MFANGLKLAAFLATLAATVNSLELLVGPDSTGRAALLSLTSEGTVASSCPLTLPELPIPGISYSVQTVINDRLVICGGASSTFYNKYCFQLGPDTDGEWLDFPELDMPRYFEV